MSVICLAQVFVGTCGLFVIPLVLHTQLHIFFHIVIHASKLNGGSSKTHSQTKFYFCEVGALDFCNLTQDLLSVGWGNAYARPHVHFVYVQKKGMSTHMFCHMRMCTSARSFSPTA